MDKANGVKKQIKEEKVIIYMPVEQSIEGIGNTLYKDVKLGAKSIQLSIFNNDGTIYNGSHTALVNIFANNEEVEDKWELLTFIVLSEKVSTYLYDINEVYKNIKVEIVRIAHDCYITGELV